MNYGYTPDTRGWREDKKNELAARLGELCNSYIDDRGMFPYVEIDSLYPGVRIRRITHLADAERDDLVQKADEIYNKVMGVSDEQPSI